MPKKKVQTQAIAKYAENGVLTLDENGQIVDPSSPQLPTLIPQQGILLMEAMNGKIPDWAIKEREGPKKTMLKYVPHGYVRDMLNKTFGPFWSFRTLEITPGKRFEVVSYHKNEWNKDLQIHEAVEVNEVVVMVELTVQIFDTAGNPLVTISKTGSGGHPILDSVPFSSALQSAESDGFKRAAFSLGRKFGLQLYYDDEELADKWQQKFMPKPVENLATLIAAIEANDITEELWEEVTKTEISNLDTKNEIIAAWAKMQAWLDTHQKED